jgi:hypothetical protein
MHIDWTILGWPFNSRLDAAVHLLFILSWAIKVNFRILVVLLNKALLLGFLCVQILDKFYSISISIYPTYLLHNSNWHDRR